MSDFEDYYKIVEAVEQAKKHLDPVDAAMYEERMGLQNILQSFTQVKQVHKKISKQEEEGQAIMYNSKGIKKYTKTIKKYAERGVFGAAVAGAAKPFVKKISQVFLNRGISTPYVRVGTAVESVFGPEIAAG